MVDSKPLLISGQNYLKTVNRDNESDREVVRMLPLTSVGAAVYAQSNVGEMKYSEVFELWTNEFEQIFQHFFFFFFFSIKQICR